MSRSDDCCHHFSAESYLASLRTERVDHQMYATHAEATRSFPEDLEMFYNPVRRHLHVGYARLSEFA